MIKTLINKRRIVQGLVGAALYIVITLYAISLWWVLLAGAITGIIFGKVFCRWMCPLGFFMEMIMGLSPDGNFRQMYQYHKLGCPVAWVSGWLNKYSFLKIRTNNDTCISCGKCDKQCYIATLNPEYSLYKPDKKHPSEQFSCSKCLKCVGTCPNGSISYTLLPTEKKAS